MQSIGILVPAGLASLLIAWFTTSRLISTSGRLRSLDIPNHRSSHSKPTPRTGGLGIALASTLIVPVLTLFLPTPPDVVNPLFTVSFWLVMLGYVTIAAVGLIDDVKQIGPLPKYLGQFLAALIAILAGVVFLQLDLPLIGRIDFTSFGFVGSLTGMVLTVVWLTGFSNIFNFMDGIDGLAAGSGAIQGLALFLLSNPSGWHQGDQGAGHQLSGASSLMLAAACLGFLVHNFPPARIFMGDVGSLFTGYVLAATAVLMAGTGSHPFSFSLRCHADESASLAPWRKASRGASLPSLPAAHRLRAEPSSGDTDLLWTQSDHGRRWAVLSRRHGSVTNCDFIYLLDDPDRIYYLCLLV
jgi:UDP-N-acetylmuramyl pentapeptide phosphotransferase/UDP-N-acetylglucosamine-1-phosphate transferase